MDNKMESMNKKLSTHEDVYVQQVVNAARETVISRRLEEMRQKNEAVNRRHTEVEMDRIQAEQAGCAVSLKQESQQVRHRTQSADFESSPQEATKSDPRVDDLDPEAGHDSDILPRAQGAGPPYRGRGRGSRRGSGRGRGGRGGNNYSSMATRYGGYSESGGGGQSVGRTKSESEAQLHAGEPLATAVNSEAKTTATRQHHQQQQHSHASVSSADSYDESHQPVVRQHVPYAVREPQKCGLRHIEDSGESLLIHVDFSQTAPVSTESHGGGGGGGGGGGSSGGGGSTIRGRGPRSRGGNHSVPDENQLENTGIDGKELETAWTDHHQTHSGNMQDDRGSTARRGRGARGPRRDMVAGTAGRQSEVENGKTLEQPSSDQTPNSGGSMPRGDGSQMADGMHSERLEDQDRNTFEGQTSHDDGGFGQEGLSRDDNGNRFRGRGRGAPRRFWRGGRVNAWRRGGGRGYTSSYVGPFTNDTTRSRTDGRDTVTAGGNFTNDKPWADQTGENEPDIEDIEGQGSMERGHRGRGARRGARRPRGGRSTRGGSAAATKENWDENLGDNRSNGNVTSVAENVPGNSSNSESRNVSNSSVENKNDANLTQQTADGLSVSRGADTSPKHGRGGSESRGSSHGIGGSESRGSSRGRGGSESRGSSRGIGGSESRGSSRGRGGSESRGSSRSIGGSESRGSSRGIGGSESRGSSRGRGGSFGGGRGSVRNGDGNFEPRQKNPARKQGDVSGSTGSVEGGGKATDGVDPSESKSPHSPDIIVEEDWDADTLALPVDNTAKSSQSQDLEKGDDSQVSATDNSNVPLQVTLSGPVPVEAVPDKSEVKTIAQTIESSKDGNVNVEPVGLLDQPGVTGQVKGSPVASVDLPETVSGGSSVVEVDGSVSNVKEKQQAGIVEKVKEMNSSEIGGKVGGEQTSETVNDVGSIPSHVSHTSQPPPGNDVISSHVSHTSQPPPGNDIISPSVCETANGASEAVAGDISAVVPASSQVTCGDAVDSATVNIQN